MLGWSHLVDINGYLAQPQKPVLLGPRWEYDREAKREEKCPYCEMPCGAHPVVYDSAHWSVVALCANHGRVRLMKATEETE